MYLQPWDGRHSDDVIAFAFTPDARETRPGEATLGIFLNGFSVELGTCRSSRSHAQDVVRNELALLRHASLRKVGRSSEILHRYGPAFYEAHLANAPKTRIAIHCWMLPLHTEYLHRPQDRAS